jgi:DHA2 family multidrug resistance protein
MSETEGVQNRAAITVCLMLATVMTALDSTIVNVALPHMQGSLSASADEIVWILTSYIVAQAMVTPITGWLANRFGIKRLFVMAVIGFTVASALCGTATSLAEIVLFRILQGCCGAFILPLSQAVLLNVYPPNGLARAMSIWSMGSLAGSMFGPVVGGYITESTNWRWCFYVNVPVGALAILGILLFLPSATPQRTRRLDFLGFGALITSVAALQLMLDRGPGQDWFGSREIWAELLVAVIAFWVFLMHTLTTKTPFVDPAVLRNRNYLAAVVFMFIVQSMVLGTLAILPLITQSLMRYPVLLSGMVSMPRACGMVISMWLAPVVAARLGSRNTLALGTLGTAFAMWQMSHYDLAMSPTPLITAGISQGVAQGLILVPVTTIAFVTLRPQDRAEAAAMLNLVRSVGGAIGISFLQGLAAGNAQRMHASLAAHVTPSDPVFRWDIGRAFSPDTLRGAEALNAEITRQATMVAYVDDFRLMCLLTLICMPLVLLVRARAGEEAFGPRPAGRAQ